MRFPMWVFLFVCLFFIILMACLKAVFFEEQMKYDLVLFHFIPMFYKVAATCSSCCLYKTKLAFVTGYRLEYVIQ